MLTVSGAVDEARRVSRDRRTAKVNELMSGTADKAGLQWRALFVTALRVAEVWPQGCL